MRTIQVLREVARYLPPKADLRGNGGSPAIQRWTKRSSPAHCALPGEYDGDFSGCIPKKHAVRMLPEVSRPNVADRCARSIAEGGRPATGDFDRHRN